MAKPPDPFDFVKRVTGKIAQARRDAGLTQEQLADLLRVTPRHIQRVEAGANLSLYALARIAGVLGLDPSRLTLPDPGEAPGPTRKARARPASKKAAKRKRATR